LQLDKQDITSCKTICSYKHRLFNVSAGPGGRKQKSAIRRDTSDSLSVIFACYLTENSGAVLDIDGGKRSAKDCNIGR